MNKDRQSIDELKFNCIANIFDLFDSLGVRYNIHGNTLKSTCPAKHHAGDGDSKSFSLNVHTGYWRCWSHSCHSKFGSDIIGLIRSITGLTFPEALEYIEKFLSNKVLDSYKVQMPKIMGRPIKPVDESLLTFLKKDESNRYCLSRGLSSEIISKYEIGFWYRPTDFMHNRVIFPIRNESGSLMGFSGRTIVPESDWDFHNIKAKWLHARYFNAPSNPNEFPIGDILFNMNFAKSCTERSIILVEGIMDGLKLSTCGINNWVCSFGSHITQAQLSKIIKFDFNRIICFYDFDNSGNSGFEQVKTVADDRISILRVPQIVAKKDPGDMSKQEIRECLNAAS